MLIISIGKFPRFSKIFRKISEKFPTSKIFFDQNKISKSAEFFFKPYEEFLKFTMVKTASRENKMRFREI